MSGVILRVRALSSSPKSVYAAWKMMLPKLPLSTSILFTKAIRYSERYDQGVVVRGENLFLLLRREAYFVSTQE
ncbi:hypothetical protein F2Q69_00059529 [Brassica cretica]|uniref:Uncharacterized protein n=1 Tax=Brassica cretica TaxID=69181 RepID=A0A8S9REU7_BRACR|nr:hypothetical protein F2Q69_00059529 [Brassica cretica]